SFASASSQYLTHVSNASLQLTGGSFTLAFWVYFNTVTGLGTCIAKSAGGVSTTEYEVGLDNASHLHFTVGNAGGLGPSGLVWGGGTPIVLSTGQWYFVCVWYDAGANTMNIQVNNGTLTSATPAGALIAPGSNAITLGARSDAVNFLNGRLDSVGVWK